MQQEKLILLVMFCMCASMLLLMENATTRIEYKRFMLAEQQRAYLVMEYRTTTVFACGRCHE
jgi:cytochrome c553